MNTIKIPNYPTHAVKHIDNSTGDGHIVFSMAFVHNHDFYYHENGNQIRQYVGDEILDVWNLQSQAQQPVIPHDFYTHRKAWRKALEIAEINGRRERPDIDDKAYWRHELRAFDRAFNSLPPAPEGDKP